MTSEAERLVIEESAKFRAALPQLLEQYRDEWVVFKGGAVVAAFEDADDALRFAVERFGRNGGFIVAEVAETAHGPIPLSAATFFVPRAS